MIYFTHDSIGALYSELEYAPKRWLKNDLAKEEDYILKLRESIRLKLNSQGIKLALQSELLEILPKLINLNKWDTKVPTLKAPNFFSRPLTFGLKITLLKLLKKHSRYSVIEKLVNDAHLDLQTPEYYTLPLKEGYVIHGNPTPTYGNLICFAHELGHALYEVDQPGDELGSEVAAFLFEDEIAGLILQYCADKNEWDTYKQAQDQLNYFLCLNEFEEFKSGKSKTKKNHLFFRESLVTCWGYQSIYAWASLERSYVVCKRAVNTGLPSAARTP